MKHVVVVEDDAVNALLLRTVLQRRGGYRVTVTEDPHHLMTMARAGEVDLVVLDVSLNESRWNGELVNGIDICRILKQDEATRSVPVLLATAHAMRGDARRFLDESGADDYVSKPVELDGFIGQVRRWLPEAA
jgi:CheY-like chemotaxis protein